MRTSARIIVAIALLSTACFETPAGPERIEVAGVPANPRTPTPPTTGSTTLISSCPKVPGPGRVFDYAGQLEYRVSSITQNSRFVLYDDGVFALQFNSSIGQYCGRYTESNGTVTFEWDGWNIGGPWGATGILKNQSLMVTYNLIMAMSDFEDAIYKRVP
jgi:hypothetical protein